MGLVLAATAFAVLVTSACTNVAGLTGYEFGDAEPEGGRDGSSDAPIPVPPDAGKDKDAGGTSCSGKFTGVDPTCAACAEEHCCADTIACALQSGCLQRAKANQCTSGSADLVCRNLTKCINANKCPCN